MEQEVKPAKNNGIDTALVGMLVGFLTFGASTLTNAAESGWQSPDSIRTAVRDFTLSRVGGQGNITVEAVAVDDRLKLPACAGPLATAAARPLRNGQGTVAVSCDAPKPWRIFVPVRTTEEISVVVAARTIKADQALSSADLQVTTRSSSTLPYEYYTDLTQALGLTAKRTIPPGAVVVPGALSAPPDLIERGAHVTLISGSGPISVKSDGVALEAGRPSDRIRVRSRSGRIVEGTVQASGAVRVGS